MNPFEMVLGIIVVVMIASILKARYRHGRERDRGDYRAAGDPGLAAENARLRDELRSLKERIQVLERVVTDDESSSRLDREIEKLRDKNSV